jgi:hypothetical protein
LPDDRCHRNLRPSPGVASRQTPFNSVTDRQNSTDRLFAREYLCRPCCLSCSCEPLATTPQPDIHTHPRATRYGISKASGRHCMEGRTLNHMHACHDSDVTLSVWNSQVIGQVVKPLSVSVVSRLCLYPVTIYRRGGLSISVHVCSLWDTHLTMQWHASDGVADNGFNGR